jgi:hypothetical protein
MNAKNTLLPLVHELTNCPSRDSEGLHKSVEDSWEALRNRKFNDLGNAKRAVLAAVIIHGCPSLAIERADHRELFRLADLLLQRFEERANPKNKVGHLIADALKEI